MPRGAVSRTAAGSAGRRGSRPAVPSLMVPTSSSCSPTSTLNVSCSLELPRPPHYLSQRLPALPGAADDGPLRIALVRRRTSGVERLPALLPDRLTGRICLFPLDCFAKAPHSGRSTPGAARSFARIPADPPERRPVEAPDERRSVGPHPVALTRHRGWALSFVVGDRPAAAALVHLGRCGAIALAALRAVEPGIFSCAAQLSVRRRAVLPAGCTGVGVVRLVCRFCSLLRSGRLAIPRRRGRTGRGRERLRRRGAVGPYDPVLAGAFDHRLRPAGLHHQPDLAGNRRESVFVGRAARHLPADVRPDV